MIRVEKPPLSTLVLVHRMPFLRVNARDKAPEASG